jgi:hypothetical protein
MMDDASLATSVLDYWLNNLIWKINVLILSFINNTKKICRLYECVIII